MRKRFFYTCSVILRQICLIAILQCTGFYCLAQSSYTGYHASSYTGVYGILNNPAEILNHRQRADINLAGVSAAPGNNIFSFRYKNRKDDNGGFHFPDPINKNGRATVNTDIFGPSVMVKLSDKHAVAITTRVRAMVNAHGISQPILNLLVQNHIDSSLINNKLALSDMAVNAHAWKELAFTYSRQIANSDYGVWKLGVSLKYLGGLAAMSFATNKLSFTYDSVPDPADNARRKDAIINNTGTLHLDFTKIPDSFSTINEYLSFKNPGVGLDVGLSYEYRDEMQVYETSYSDRTANYIWRLGAAITDIGFIRYNKKDMDGLAVNFAGSTYLVDQLTAPSDSGTGQQIANYYKTLFNARSEPSALVMQLPTTLHLSYDRYFNKVMGLQAQLNIPLLFSRINFYTGNYNPVSVSITPRAEIPLGGVYVPVSYNSVSGFQMGAAMRLGPLVIGSASIINSRIIGRTKTADVYFILRVPFFGYREYKNKITGQQVPALTRRQRRQLDCPR
jgi:hypothetical protein